MPLPILIPAALSALALGLGPATGPGCELSLTLQQESGTTISSTVACEPVSGTHPNAAAVCDALSKVDGDFTKIPRSKGMACSDDFKPVTVTAQGDWHGKAVNFTHTYSNRCYANIAMGKIFDF